jgi:hypothetical protein
LKITNKYIVITNIKQEKNQVEVENWSFVISHRSLVIGHWSFVIGHLSLRSKEVEVEVKAGAVIASPIAKRIGSGNLLSHFVFGWGGG